MKQFNYITCLPKIDFRVFFVNQKLNQQYIAEINFDTRLFCLKRNIKQETNRVFRYAKSLIKQLLQNNNKNAFFHRNTIIFNDTIFKIEEYRLSQPKLKENKYDFLPVPSNSKFNKDYKIKFKDYTVYININCGIYQFDLLAINTHDTFRIPSKVEDEIEDFLNNNINSIDNSHPYILYKQVKYEIFPIFKVEPFSDISLPTEELNIDSFPMEIKKNIYNAKSADQKNTKRFNKDWSIGGIQNIKDKNNGFISSLNINIQNTDNRDRWELSDLSGDSEANDIMLILEKIKVGKDYRWLDADEIVRSDDEVYENKSFKQVDNSSIGKKVEKITNYGVRRALVSSKEKSKRKFTLDSLKVNDYKDSCLIKFNYYNDCTAKVSWKDRSYCIDMENSNRFADNQFELIYNDIAELLNGLINESFFEYSLMNCGNDPYIFYRGGIRFECHEKNTYKKNKVNFQSNQWQYSNRNGIFNPNMLLNCKSTTHNSISIPVLLDFQKKQFHYDKKFDIGNVIKELLNDNFGLICAGKFELKDFYFEINNIYHYKEAINYNQEQIDYKIYASEITDDKKDQDTFTLYLNEKNKTFYLQDASFDASFFAKEFIRDMLISTDGLISNTLVYTKNKHTCSLEQIFLSKKH